MANVVVIHVLTCLMRAMPNLSSNRRALVASASFVFALGAVTVSGPTERLAFAQPAATKKKDKERKDKDSANAAAAEDEKKKAAEAEASKTSEAEHKKELDVEKIESAKAIYFSGDLAITRSDLGALSDNLGFDRTGANGFLYGLSGGLRLKDLRFGMRWRVYDTTEFTLWSFAVSAGYALPFRPLTPIFSGHVGYVFDQKIQPALFRSSLPEGNVLPPDVDVKGLLLGFDVNASYWITKFLRLGGFIGADLMVLHREKTPFPQSLFGPTPEINAKPLYADSGSGLGLNVSIGLRGAFDIGFQ